MRGAAADQILVFLGHATEDADDLFRMGALVARQSPQRGIDFVLGVLADATRVDQDNVGVASLVGDFVAEFPHPANDELAIEHVHLAADGFDKELLLRHGTRPRDRPGSPDSIIIANPTIPRRAEPREPPGFPREKPGSIRGLLFRRLPVAASALTVTAREPPRMRRWERRLMHVLQVSRRNVWCGCSNARRALRWRSNLWRGAGCPDVDPIGSRHRGSGCRLAQLLGLGNHLLRRLPDGC